MALIKHHKVVAALPSQLEADAIYYVRTGAGFDLYVTNGSGQLVAYPVNTLPGGYPLPTDSRYIWGFQPGKGWVVAGSVPVLMPSINDDNATFTDEGAATTGWSPSNVTLSAASSYVRVTKNVTGGGALASKAVILPAENKDYIIYGKVRARASTSDCAVLWMLSGSKEVSIWFGTSNAGGSGVAVGAMSICGTTGTSTRNVASLGTGYDYQNNAIEFALHFDQKFQTLTAYIKEADGRWKWKARVACSWFAGATLDMAFTSGSPVGAWSEFDYLMVCRPNVAVLSDSIGEGKTLFSPDPSLGLTNDESTWMRHAALYPQLRNNLIVNKGVGGNTSAQMLARIADVTGLGVRTAIVHASSNDERAGVSQAQRTSTIQSIVTSLRDAGANVVLLNAMRATSTSADNTSPRALMAYTRDWWSTQRPALTGIHSSLDISEAVRLTGSEFMDPALAQSDGVHPNVTGHTRIGSMIKSA